MKPAAKLPVRGTPKFIIVGTTWLSIIEEAQLALPKDNSEIALLDTDAILSQSTVTNPLQFRYAKAPKKSPAMPSMIFIPFFKAYPIKNPAMPPDETEVNMNPTSYAKSPFDAFKH